VSRRTTFQVAFFLMAIIIWGYGHRIDDPTVRLAGIAFFAVAFLLRFFRSSETRHRQDEEEETEAE
jgi:preprotein translocase subunit SecG